MLTPGGKIVLRRIFHASAIGRTMMGAKPFLAIAFILAATGCCASAPTIGRSSDPPDSRAAHARAVVACIDASLSSAAQFLAAAQSPDGAWRSQVYGPLRDGPSLTPHVLTALWFAAQAEPPARPAFDRGAR